MELKSVLKMFRLSPIFVSIILTFTPFTQSTSQIALFTDGNCKDSLRGMTGPNGYPNGTCTDMRRSGPYGSFQVVGLDEGCTVTIYANDTTTDPCSGYAEVAAPIACYNSTFFYYSIDYCMVGGAQASTVPTSSSTPGPSAGAIAGGVIGGVAVLGLIIAIVMVVLKKRKAKRLASMPQESGGTAVWPWYDQAPHKIGRGSPIYKNNAVEVQQPPVELGGRDYIQVPVELGGREMAYQDVNGTY